MVVLVFSSTTFLDAKTELNDQAKEESKHRKQKRYFIPTPKLRHASNWKIRSLFNLFTMYKVFFKRVLNKYQLP